MAKLVKVASVVKSTKEGNTEPFAQGGSIQEQFITITTLKSGSSSQNKFTEIKDI